MSEASKSMIVKKKFGLNQLSKWAISAGQLSAWLWNPPAKSKIFGHFERKILSFLIKKSLAEPVLYPHLPLPLSPVPPRPFSLFRDINCLNKSKLG
jgi:hypothetical protein